MMQTPEMKTVRYTMSASEFHKMMLLDDSYDCYFPRFHEALHRWSHRYGFHDWLVKNRFYRRWGNTRWKYNASKDYTKQMAKAIADDIDRQILQTIGNELNERREAGL